MGFFTEIKAVLIPKEISFIEMKKEDEGIYTFVFEPVKALDWTAGKHAMFFITHKKIDRAMRLFSISSCPSENRIAITTKIGENPSDYKRALLELQPSMKMTLRGPMGPFTLQKGRTNCFITGGIGITPFRSMMIEAYIGKAHIDGNIKLLYINSSGSFLFGEELMKIKNAKISTELFTDRNVLANRIKEMTVENSNITYFIAGPKLMISSITQKLLELGVKKKNIKTDTFIGY